MPTMSGDPEDRGAGDQRAAREAMARALGEADGPEPFEPAGPASDEELQRLLAADNPSRADVVGGWLETLADQTVEGLRAVLAEQPQGSGGGLIKGVVIGGSLVLVAMLITILGAAALLRATHGV